MENLLEIRRFVSDDSVGSDSEISVTRSTKTNADSKYRITRIRFAFLLFTFAFGIVVTAPGFVAFTDDSVELKLGEIRAIDVRMEEN